MMIWHIFTEHTLCKLHAVCQGGGSEQDKAPTLMLSQCWGASHVNGCMVGSDMSPWKDSDGVLWGAVGGREEDQPGGRRRPSSVWGGSTHPGPWKMERNYSRGVSRVRVYTVCALEEHSFVWEYVETLKLQRLTQGPAASQTSQGRKEQNTNGLILSIMGLLRRKMQQGLNCKEMLLKWVGSSHWKGLDSSRRGTAWEHEQCSETGMCSLRTHWEKSLQTLVEATKCMLGGDVGQFDYVEPKSLSSSVGLQSSRKIQADEFWFHSEDFYGLIKNYILWAWKILAQSIKYWVGPKVCYFFP